jgi:hypothetical protein
MFCSDTKNYEKKCAPSLAGTNGPAACEQLKEKETNAWDAVKSASNPMASIVSAFSSGADSDQTIINKMGLKIDTRTIIDQVSKCDNAASSIQVNSIVGPSADCINAWSAAGWSLEDIKKASKISNVTQSNVSQMINDCKANQIVSALTKMQVTIDNVALQRTINKAKGLMSKSSSDQFTCNSIDVNQSACKYLSQNQCCSNRSSSNQMNLLDRGCTVGDWSNIDQKNESKQYSRCLLSAQSSVSDDLAGKIFNKSSQAAENTSEGLTMSFLIVLIILIALVIGAPIILVGTLGNKIFTILGILLIIAGIVCIVLYYKSKKPMVHRVNEPFSMCDGTKSTGGSKKVKFGSIDQKAYGYDFIPDDQKMKVSDIKGTTWGLYVPLNEVDRKDTTCKPTDRKVKSVSHLAATEEKIFLYLGAALMSAGVVQILIGLFKKEQSTGDLSENDDGADDGGDVSDENEDSE